MGGNAFKTHSPPLPTPRMPRDIFTKILASTTSILKEHFHSVESATEGPGKITFGDVDILVALPLSPCLDPSQTSQLEIASHLQAVLCARAFVSEKNNPTIIFAIPWPGDESRYIQVDIHFCSSPESLTWELFHSAHGDLWNILGTTMRPYGLTVNDRAMYLRIPDIELLDRKRSMIYLTSSPSQILSLLGLDEKRWWTAFDSQDEMFEYAATCRMFSVKSTAEEGVQEGDVIGTIEGQVGGEEGRKKLKHNDRARMAKRPVFAAWIDGFVTACREKGLYTSCGVTRDQIRDECFDAFGIKEEYEARSKEWRLERHLDELLRQVIKGTVPVEGVDTAFRAAAIRHLKSVIMEGERFDGEVVEEVRRNDDGFYDLERVRDWVLANWQRAGEIGWAVSQEKVKEAMKVKAKLKRMRELESSGAGEATETAVIVDEDEILS